jgi:hypothetical protein
MAVNLNKTFKSEMATAFSFWNVFIEFIRDGTSHREAYELAEELHEIEYIRRRFASYDSFRTYIKKHFKNNLKKRKR